MSRRRSEVPTTTPVPPGIQQSPGASLAELQRDAAEYLSDMILELRNLARNVKLHRVMVPLEFAYYEAFGAAHRVEVPAAELERLRTLSGTADALEAEGANGSG